MKKAWWIILLVVGMACVYFHGMHEKGIVLQDLQGRLKGLEQEKIVAQHHQEELLMEIQSQADPAWVELRLMEELGMTPEGSVKVYFNNP